MYEASLFEPCWNSEALSSVPTMELVFYNPKDMTIAYENNIMAMPYGKWHEYRNVFYSP